MSNNNNNKYKYIILLLLINLVILLILLFKNNCCNKHNNNRLEIDLNQSDYISNNIIDNNTTNNNIVLPGWTSITIPSNTKDINTGIDLYNPSSNENKYLLKFSLYLTNNDELLYSSNLVEANKHIYNITLNKTLSSGTYDAYILIEPYKLDRETKCNIGKVVIKLIVE